MSEDLISKRRLFDDLNSSGIEYNARINNVIMMQPAAFNVDKILDRLEDMIKACDKRCKKLSEEHRSSHVFALKHRKQCLEEVIEIIKGETE